MPLSRATLENQLGQAKSALEKRATLLQQSGVESTGLRRDPKWRELTADVQQISRRLRAVTQKEATTAEVLARREAGEGDDAADE